MTVKVCDKCGKTLKSTECFFVVIDSICEYHKYEADLCKDCRDWLLKQLDESITDETLKKF